MTTVAQYRATMREDAMREAIAEAVGYRGGRLWFVRRSDVAPELVDLPDLLIIDPRGGRVLLVELKSHHRDLTPGQAAVLIMAGECQTFASFVVRPEPRDATETGYDQFLDWLTGGDT